MKTYIYNQRSSPKRGMDVRITVYRIRRNQPHLVGCSDHQTASWYGARGEAVGIIHDRDGIPRDTKKNGDTDRYSLRGLLGFVDMYEDIDRGRQAIRLFECSGACQ